MSWGFGLMNRDLSRVAAVVEGNLHLQPPPRRTLNASVTRLVCSMPSHALPDKLALPAHSGAMQSSHNHPTIIPHSYQRVPPRELATPGDCAAWDHEQKNIIQPSNDVTPSTYSEHAASIQKSDRETSHLPSVEYMPPVSRTLNGIEHEPQTRSDTSSGMDEVEQSMPHRS